MKILQYLFNFCCCFKHLDTKTEQTANNIDLDMFASVKYTELPDDESVTYKFIFNV